MARLLTCGFGLQSAAAGMEAAGPALLTNAATISTSVIRATNGASLRCLASGVALSRGLSFQFLNTAGSGPYYARTYFRVAAYPDGPDPSSIFGWTSGGGVGAGTVSINTDGTLRLDDEDGLIGTSAALDLDTWYRLELEFNGTGAGASDTLNLYIDGTLAVGSTTRDIASTVNLFSVGQNYAGTAYDGAVNTGDWFFTDLAVNDSTGAAQTGLPGSGTLTYLRPNGAGDADTGSPTRGGADSGTIEGQLDETTPNDATDYVVLPNNPSDFWVDVQPGSTGGIGASDTITLVEVNARVSAVSASTSNHFPQIKKTSGGTVASATAVTRASAGWDTNDDTIGTQQCKLVRYTDPDGAAWTPSTIDSMQISERTTDGNPDTWVSAIWAIVEYVPAAVAAGPQPYALRFVRKRKTRDQRQWLM